MISYNAILMGLKSQWIREKLEESQEWIKEYEKIWW